MSAPDTVTLETERLVIRRFALDDLDAIHAILNEAFSEVPRTERQEWLEWTVRNDRALARLYQPPYGDRAIVLQATEAARALVAFAFAHLHLKRIVAMTEEDNTASIAVMQRLGMTVQRHPDPAPEWFQVVGILDNPAGRAEA